MQRADKRQERLFDAYAENYVNGVDNELSAVLKGSSHEYFNRYKIFYIKKLFQKLSQPLKILDYGCGVGLFSRTISDVIPNVTIYGFDVSSKSIEQVPSELRIKNHNRFTSNLDELDSDYNIALLVTVLHHVETYIERIEVMTNIYQRLSKGGICIIIEHNFKNPLTNRIVKNSPVDEEKFMLTPSECKRLLEKAGFLNIFSRYIVFFPKQLSFLRFIDQFIPWLPLGAQHLTYGYKY